MLATLHSPDSALYAACHAMADAGSRLVVRAQQAGVVRPDVLPADVFALAGALAWLREQTADPDQPDRLLALVLDALTGPVPS